jgi:hypothetical protein
MYFLPCMGTAKKIKAERFFCKKNQRSLY